MRCRQVRRMIDGNQAGRSGGDEQAAILAHFEECAECARQRDLAAVAASFIKARASQEVEPTPFFKTRVLAAIRERGAVTVRSSAERMWRSARATVGIMFAVVIVLLALNLILPRPPVETAMNDTARSRDSVERVVMEDTSAAPDESLSSGQVLDTVFAQGDSYGID